MRRAAAGAGAVCGLCAGLCGPGTPETGMHGQPITARATPLRFAIPGDGHAIAGIWRDLGPDTPVVLLLHGMRGDRASTLPRARAARRRRIFRAADRPAGAWRDAGRAHHPRLARIRGRARRARLVAHPGAGRRVGVLGVSLGGASFLIGERPAPVDALVLEAVHPRLRRAIEKPCRPMVRAAAARADRAAAARRRSSSSIRSGTSRRRRAGAGGGRCRAMRTRPGKRPARCSPRHTSRRSCGSWLDAAHEDFSRADAAGYREHVIGFLRRTLAPQEGFR